MTEVLFGNLNITAFEEKANIKFNEKDREWLKEHRQDSANNVKKNEFHIHDMPLRITCGSDIFDEMLNMIKSYDLSQVKRFGLQIIN